MQVSVLISTLVMERLFAIVYLQMLRISFRNCLLDQIAVLDLLEEEEEKREVEKSPRVVFSTQRSGSYSFCLVIISISNV